MSFKDTAHVEDVAQVGLETVSRIERICLWYADGTVWEGTPETWDSAPTNGLVHGCALYSDHTSQNLSGGDIWWCRDGIIASDNDRDGYLRRFCPNVKWGVWVRKDQLDKAFDEARAVMREWNAQRAKPCCD